MAWPNSRLTTYIANSTPVIKAFDLNEIQDKIAAIVSGFLSLRAVQVDGAGGVAVTPPNGSVQVSRDSSSTTAPSPAWSVGQCTTSTLPIGWAYIFGGTGNLAKGHNLIIAPTRTGAGQYTIKLNVPGSYDARVSVQVTPTGAVGGLRGACYTTTSDGTNLVILVVTYDLAGTAVDTNFSLVVFG